MDDIKSLTITIEEFLKKENLLYKVKTNEEDEQSIIFDAGRKYSIPAYQREIRWPKKNVQNLITDLKSSKKFLGTVVLSTTDKKSFDIIDGQQRITVIVLLLEYICNIKLIGRFERCDFFNATYPDLDKMISINFDISNDSLTATEKETLEKNDVLEQTPRYKKEIWGAIVSTLKKYEPEELSTLKDNILASKVNIILNYERAGSETSKKQSIFQYLDINDKSVPLDKIDILKAYLFKDDFKMWSENWIKIQNVIGELRFKNVEYDVQNIFYQYFLCCANEKLNWTLTGINTSYATKNGNKSKPKYFKGKHITEVIKDYDFYKKMSDRLYRYLVFLRDIENLQGYSSEWDQYFILANGKLVSDVTRKCVFRMYKSILSFNEQVPKMLLMKYFLYVLSNDKATSSAYETIYNIYYSSVMFVSLKDKKNSDEFAKIVLAKDWEKELDIKTRYYSTRVEEIWYRKKVSRRGYTVETAGQELPRHIFAIKYYWKQVGGKFKPSSPKDLVNYLGNTLKNTMEHFLLNKSGSIEYTYGPSNQKGEYKYPKKLFNDLVQCPINYLVLDEKVNTELGNMPLGKKKEYISNLKEKEIWGNELVKDYYLCAIDVFFKSEHPFPSDFSTITTEEEVNAMYDEYFENYFISDVNRYEEKVKKLGI